MATKRDVLAHLTHDELLAVVDRFSLVVPDRRANEGLVEAVAASKKATHGHPARRLQGPDRGLLARGRLSLQRGPRSPQRAAVGRDDVGDQQGRSLARRAPHDG